MTRVTRSRWVDHTSSISMCCANSDLLLLQVSGGTRVCDFGSALRSSVLMCYYTILCISLCTRTSHVHCTIPYKLMYCYTPTLCVSVYCIYRFFYSLHMHMHTQVCVSMYMFIHLYCCNDASSISCYLLGLWHLKISLQYHSHCKFEARPECVLHTQYFLSKVCHCELNSGASKWFSTGS